MPSSGPEQPSSEERDVLAAAERAGRPFVHLRDGAGQQRLITLPDEGDALTVGRGPWADIPLPWDDQVSRLHAQLERLGDDWTVVDEGLSTNGTFLNGERLTGRRRVADGDEIRFGSTVVTVRIPCDLGGQATQIATRPRSDPGGPQGGPKPQ